MKLLLFSGIVLGLSSLWSCGHYELDETFHNENNKIINSEESILSFDSKDYFQKIMNESENDFNLRSGSDYSSGTKTELPYSESLYGTSEYEELWSEYVPNHRLAKKLNKNGEIIVNDTLYKITTNGTYFFHKAKKNDFIKIYTADSTATGTLISDKLYLIGKDIYRYDSFENDDNYDNEEYTTFEMNNEPTLRSFGAEPDYNSFPFFNSDRVTVVGKIIQNIIGAKKKFTVGYEHTNKRRVRGSFYEIKYVFYTESGATGWTDKKNLIGWSKTEADELRVGWHNVVLITKLPDTEKLMMQQMKDLKNIITNNQYLHIPGSMYKVNAITMVVKDFDPTAFDKAVSLGATSVFNLLKSKFGGKVSGLNQNTVLLILTRTHLITYIPNQDIIKYNCKEHTQVFAQQVKFKIPLSSSSFSKDLAQIAGTIIKIIGQSSELEHPTLAAGEVHVAARFGNEWQGMKIKKQTNSILTTLHK